MADDSESGSTEHDLSSAESGGMKARLTSDGKGAAVPLSPQEAAEMRGESDEWDERLADLLDQEASFLNERFQEVLATGTTTIRSSGGAWTATLERSRWRDGWLIGEGTLTDGRRYSSRTRVSRKSSGDQLQRAITLQLGIGMMSLMES
jgi:hypothetical protein